MAATSAPSTSTAATTQALASHSATPESLTNPAATRELLTKRHPKRQFYILLAEIANNPKQPRRDLTKQKKNKRGQSPSQIVHINKNFRKAECLQKKHITRDETSMLEREGKAGRKVMGKATVETNMKVSLKTKQVAKISK